MRFEEKNIGILGLGKSGYWSAKLAKSLKNNVFVSDSNTNVNEMFVDDLKMLGVDVEIGIHSNQILESDLIIKSPGIPNDSEIMNKINSEKIPVISEIEFAGNHSKTKNICITGTNGKTTTVSLLTEMLSKEMNVLKSGNIGIPFSKVVLENKLYDKNDIDYCILELSSFQLEHCSKLKKEIYDACRTIVEHEDAFIDLAFEMGPMKGLTAQEVKDYIRFIGNRRLVQLGLEPIYDVEKNPLTWLDTMLNAVEHMNFFEGRATEYSKASTQGNWTEAFS